MDQKLEEESPQSNSGNEEDDEQQAVQLNKELQDMLNSQQVEVYPVNKHHEQEKKIKNEQFLELVKDKSKKQAMLKILQNMSFQEKYAWINSQKDKGNKLFKQQKYQDAIQFYEDAILGVEIDESKKINEKMKSDLLVPILSNLSFCLFKEKKFQNTVRMCDYLINIEPQFAKAYYRKAQAYFQLGDYDNSQTNFLQAKQLMPEQTQFIDLEMNKMLAQKNKEARAYKKFFTEQEQEQQPKIIKKPSIREKLESKYGKGKVSKYFIVPLLYPFQYIYEKFDCKRKIQELVDNGRSSSSSDDIDLDE